MIVAAVMGKIASRNSAGAYDDCPWAALPTMIGPTDPPRLPIMFTNPIAEAAAAPPRKIVGIGQNAGRCEYMNVPTRKTMIRRDQTQAPSKTAARAMLVPKQINGSATWSTRSRWRSECQPFSSMPSSPNKYGKAATTDAHVSDSPDWDLMMLGMNMERP